MPKLTKTAETKRDVTIALDILRAIRIDNALARRDDRRLDDVIKLLTDIDARTGKRDPTKRAKAKP